MFSKMSKSAKFSIILGIVCALLLIGGTYLYYQSDMETITVYVAPEVSQKQAVPQLRNLQSSPASDVHGHIDASKHESAPGPMDTLSPTPVQDALNREKLASEDVANDSEDFYLHLVSQLEALTAQMDEKYPEIAEISGLSLEEIRSRFPTYSDLETITEQGRKLREDYMDGLRSIFLKLPKEVREEALSALWEHFAANVGTEITDEAIADFKAEMGL